MEIGRLVDDATAQMPPNTSLAVRLPEVAAKKAAAARKDATLLPGLADREAEFRANLPRPVTPRVLQDQTEGLGARINWSRSSNAPNPPAVQQADEALRSDMGDMLTAAVPAVAGPKRESSIRRAIDQALADRVPQLDQRSPFGLGSTIAGTAAATAATALAGPGAGAMGAIGGAVAGNVLTNPRHLATAALMVKKAADRVAPLADTAAKLAPYATMETFLRIAGESAPPTGDEARTKGQIVTGAVKELLDQPAISHAPVAQIDQAIQQLVSDVSLLVGGTADATMAKARSPRLLQQLMASHATERP
jgi:hypothetical protein